MLSILNLYYQIMMKKPDNNSIRSFILTEMWGGKADIVWQRLNDDVNILVGINGAGKTTLLNAMYAYYTDASVKKQYGIAQGSPLEGTSISYVRSFDVPANVKRSSRSQLMEELENLVIKNKNSYSFFDYRMRALNFPDEAATVNKRIEKFMALVNTFFVETKKHIVIDREQNSLVFIDEGVYGNRIELEQLSAGEKQLLLILLTVFLMDRKPAVLLMDEPELSLHVSWQEKLIKALRGLNPHCQLILTTHSPSIFAMGWEDKLVFIDDIIRFKDGK